MLARGSSVRATKGSWARIFSEAALWAALQEIHRARSQLTAAREAFDRFLSSTSSFAAAGAGTSGTTGRFSVFLGIGRGVHDFQRFFGLALGIECPR
jgi:hypothetical protein